MIRIGSLDARSIRFLAPPVGAWQADVDLDLEHDAPLPSGRVTLTIGTSTLQGTVVAPGTGRFGETARVRVVAGGAGWGTVVRAEHFHNDAGGGVTSSMVLAATASAVGETVVDPSPVAYGKDYFRLAEEASSVLQGRSWYVDADGVTRVTPWPTRSLGTDADVLTYDPATRVVLIAADEVIWPGTTITDPRFGRLVVVEVDQVFSASGSRATVLVADNLAARLDAAIEALIRGLSADEWLRVHWYRIALEGVDGRLQLQAVRKDSGAPDTLPIDVWPGMSGLSATHTLGTEVAVVFLNGDRSQPRVVSFDGRAPIELVLDATSQIKIGVGAVSPAAKGDVVDANFVAAKTFASAVGTVVASCVGPSPSQQSAFAAALSAFLAAVQNSIATKARVE